MDYALDLLAAAAARQDRAAALFAWEFGRDSWNSWMQARCITDASSLLLHETYTATVTLIHTTRLDQVVNRAIVAKVGDPFEPMS